VIGVDSRFQAGTLHVLATDGGNHPAVKWASVTSQMIVKPREDASVEARAQIANLQLRIAEILVGVFEEVKASTSAYEILVITNQASRAIAEISTNTQWHDVFAAEPIQAAIEELIRRNLASSTEIALRME